MTSAEAVAALTAHAKPLDHSSIWSLEGKALIASSLCDLAVQFEGVPDLMQLHVGLPTPTSFPLVSISASTSPFRPTTTPTNAGVSNPMLSSPLTQLSQPIYSSCTSSPTSTHDTTVCRLQTQRSSSLSEPDLKLVELQAALHSQAPSKVEQARQQQGVQPSEQPPQEPSEAQATGVPHASFTIQGSLVHDAQQYMFHRGHTTLKDWAARTAQRCHQPPNRVEVTVTSGAVHALTCAISVMCDRGDYVLCEEFTYTHLPECVFVPRGLHMLPVTMDEHGMVPSALKAVLASTPPSPATGRLPRVMYTIPSGQNPTGAVMPTHRKREIYQICREHDILILEDDAYYWLQYPRGSLPAAQQPGLQLPASYLSMDVDSRVLRVDTFAKLLGPGYRIGWVTGHPTLIAKMYQAVQASSVGVCSLSQVVVAELLAAWGDAGFEAFVQRQQALYAARADLVCAAAAEHLTGLAQWSRPTAGMFFWGKLTGLPDFSQQLVDQLVAHRVVVVPGRPFWTDSNQARSGAPCPYFRITYGSATEAEIREGFSRLAAAIRAAQACTAAQLTA